MKMKTNKTIRQLLIAICAWLVFSPTLAQDYPTVLVKNSGKSLTQVYTPASKVYLNEALEKLKSRFKISFFYNPQLVNHQIVKFMETDEDLDKQLEALLTPLDLTFQKIDQSVYVITQKNSRGIKANQKKEGEIGRQRTHVTEDLIEMFTPKSVKFDLRMSKLITGRVIDEETNLPMPGVNVVVKNTTIGTTTDSDGKFSISVPDDAKVLLFSSIGYKTLEVPIGSQVVMNVKLSPDITALKEIIVVGYGEQKREDVTGSISSIKAQELKTVPMAGIDQLMQGRASGVMVTQNTGQPGGGVSVRIRGITSLTGSNEPLYVIDGVPFTGDGVQSQAFSAFGGGGGQTSQSILSSINPADIVSVDILKDASATAIYGSRASNGVVLITTKRGKANDSKISYDTYYGFQQVPKYLPVMNLQEYASFINQIRAENNQQPQEEFRDVSLLGKGTDWQRQIFRTAPIVNHQIGLSGGKDKIQYYVSGGYFQQDGIIVGSNFDRYTIRLNLDNQAKDWLKIGTSITASRTNQRVTLTDDDNGVVSAALLQAPNIPVSYPDGSWGGPEDINSGLQTNPVAMALLRDVRRMQNRFLGNFYADVNLYKGLTFRSSFGGDITYSENTAYNPTYQWGAVINTQNKYIRGNNQSFFWMWQNYLTYNKNIGEDHKLTGMIGHEAMKSQYEWLSGTRTGFYSNDVQALNAGTAISATNENGKGASTLESVFGRVNYGFKDKYNLTVTYRIDGSSKFGPSNRWGAFPSVAGAWTISNESFMKEIKALSNLKLRAGYGVVGNQNINNYAFGAALKPIITAYGTGFFVDKIPNSSVRWESATQTNLGLDVGLFNDRVTFSVDVYDKTSKDFLYILPLPAYTGAGSNWDDIQAPYVNLGKMQNKGIDLTVNTENINSNGFSWRSTLILSAYRNKVLELVDDKSAIFRNVQWFNTVTKSAVGQPVGQFYGFVTDGIFQTLDEVNSAPAQADKVAQGNGTWVGDIRFKNIDETPVNGKQVIDGNDRTYIGSPHPKFTFGFTNSLSYKNFDISIFLQGSYGNKIFNFTRRYTEGMNGVAMNQLRSVTNRWTPDNPSNTMPRTVLGDPNGNNRVSDRFVEDGSYLRIQNIAFGYVLPNNFLNRFRLSKLRLYGAIQNLWTFTKYTGYDPELGAYNQDALLMNVDNGHYPNPRTYTLGLNIEF
ncbi:MAG: TonB-dependent receptor [Thermoflexibacter sp.]